jgi:hypothetical protein
LTTWILAVAPLVGVFADAIGQVVVSHATARIGMSIIIGFTLGLLSTIVCTALGSAGLQLPDAVAAWFISLGAFVALAVCFWAFINLNITSLRIRVLRELLHDGNTSFGAMAERYSTDEMLSRRLDRLLNGKQVRCDAGRYYLKSTAILMLVHLVDAARAVAIPARARRTGIPRS